MFLGFEWYAPYRGIDPSDTDSAAILDITYASPDTSATGWFPYTNVDRHVLAPDTPVSVITPHHPLGEKRFVAPFFMEDRRHAFFVSTSQEVKWLQDFFDLGIVYNPGPMVEVTIPPLIVQPEEVLRETKSLGRWRSGRANRSRSGRGLSGRNHGVRHAGRLYQAGSGDVGRRHLR